MVTPNRQSYSTQQNNLNSGINTGNRIKEAHSSSVNYSLTVGYLTDACCTVSDALSVTASSHTETFKFKCLSGLVCRVILPHRCFRALIPTSVSPRVNFELGWVFKLFLTGAAGVRLLTCVRPHVIQQMDVLDETFSTGVTDVRFLARVDHHVLLQRRQFGKPFATGVADVRPLTCVGSYVDHQAFPRAETFPTGLAGIKFLPCVNGHVVFQRR